MTKPLLAQREPASRTSVQLSEELTGRVEFLRGVSLFEDLKTENKALETLASTMTLRTYRAGEDIIREGETGSELYLLMEGNAGVFKSTAEGEPYKVTILHGEQRPFFGEGGLLDNDARSATIKAEGVCKCLILDRPAFEQFGVAHPEWALPILRRIARAVMARIRKANHDLTLLYNALVAEIRGH